MTLAGFLLARIAEDDGLAREARTYRWDTIAFHDLADSDAPHVARHSPERVMAECEARRRIVVMHPEAPHGCPTRDGGQEWREDACDTLLALASSYADHPDWRQEWRP